MSHFWGKSFNLKSYFNSVSEAFLFEYWNTHCGSIKAAHLCKTWCNWSAMQNTRAVIFLFTCTFIFKHSKLTWYSNWGQLACKLQWCEWCTWSVSHRPSSLYPSPASIRQQAVWCCFSSILCALVWECDDTTMPVNVHCEFEKKRWQKFKCMILDILKEYL